MAGSTLRVGIVGAGQNTRQRHIPGLRALPDVEIVSVCNRRPESTQAVAREFGIPRAHQRWDDLVADDEIDAVVIGTWPYLHAPVTIAALEAGKHVLCEARMARNLTEARAMLAAWRRRPELVAQIVPSPFGMKGDRVMKRLIAEGYLGAIRELYVYGMTDAWADPATPFHWRQSADYSGLNMLALGIVHETVMRWAAPVVRVLAQTHRFTMTRFDAESGRSAVVGSPDCVGVLTEHADGARGVYQFSGITHFGKGHGIELYGTQGTLCYRLDSEQILGARQGESELQEIAVPPEEEYQWRVEAEFVGAIRGSEQIELTDLPTGVAYMAFTQAVADSARLGQAMLVESA